MKPREAAFLLGLDITADLDAADIRRAFGERIKQAHPDTSDDPAADHETVRAVKHARDVLLDHYAGGYPPNRMRCPTCRGSGLIGTRQFKPEECPRCRGRGDVKG